jgi:outer membrane lipoprotein-sorting protein
MWKGLAQVKGSGLWRVRMAAITGLVVVSSVAAAFLLLGAGRASAPQHKPLADAIHDSASGPPVQGVTARVTFTNSLLPSGNGQSQDPLMGSSSGRLWLSRDGKTRVELHGQTGDAQLVSDGNQWLLYNPATRTAYRGQAHPGGAKPSAPQNGPASVDDINKRLGAISQHNNLSDAVLGSVASRPAYTADISPKDPTTLLQKTQLSFDAQHPVLLRMALYSRQVQSPVLELAATDVSYGPVDAKVFQVTPPPGTKIIDAGRQASPKSSHGEPTKPPSAVNAPSSLAGLPQTNVRPLGSDKGGAWLATYGQGPGSVVVIKRPSTNDKPGPSQPPVAGQKNITVNGVPGTELGASLGTVVSFARAGADYTVIGLLPPAVVEQAAGQL